MITKDWEVVIKNVGLDVSKNCSSADYSGMIVNFLKGFHSTAGQSPSEDLWDFRLDNRRLIDKWHLSQIITKEDDLFFVNLSYLHGEPHFCWKIALTTAANPLFVYHLLIKKDFSAISLIFLLIDKGICFHTLLCLMDLIIPTNKTAIGTA